MAKVRLGVKEWKIFQGKTEEGLIYVLAWKRNEKKFQAPHHCRVLENSFLLRPIYLTDRFSLRRVKDEASNFCRERSLFLTMAKTYMKDPTTCQECQVYHVST